MRRSTLAPLALSVVAAVAALGAPAAADTGDGPVRKPGVAWEHELDCDRALCRVAARNDTVFVQSFDARTADDARLLAFDIETGAPRWDVTTGPATQLWVSDAAVLVGDKTRIATIDPATGGIVADRDGSLVGVNRYGTVVVADDEGVLAISATSDSTLWRVDSGLVVGTICRDLVVLIPPSGSDPAPFRVVDHHTGERRWSSEHEFDPATDHLACGGQTIYLSDGRRLTALYAVDGWRDWTSSIDAGAGAIELYRDVALISATDGSSTVTAVDREDGDVLWQRPDDAIGQTVSSMLRLRRDDSGVFTLHPTTGDIVNHTPTPASPDARMEVIGVSDTRLVAATGAVVATYGAADLGLAWELELGDVPDDVAVSNDTLVVRTGNRLVGYR